MTAAIRRQTRTPTRPPRGPNYAAFGREGKRALREKIAALRASVPEDVLGWINEDPLLRKTFRGLERLGQTTVTVTKRNRLDPGVAPQQRFTVIELHHHVVAQFNLIGANQHLRYFARQIIDKLDSAPRPWLARLRRCAYKDTTSENGCDRPYFWDDTDDAGKQYCTPAHKKAASRQRRHS
jgi:hypothetical protein